MSLAGGEARTTRISIETLYTGEAVTAAEAEIQALQETTKGKVLREPDPGISG
jgi:hypothetical protein